MTHKEKPLLPPPAGLVPTGQKVLVEEEDSDTDSSPLRIIPLRGSVLFPHNVLPLTAGREVSSAALDRAIRAGSTVGLVAWKDGHADETDPKGLCAVGTEARIAKVIRFPDNSYGAIFQGIRRFRISQIVDFRENNWSAEVEPIESAQLQTDAPEFKALLKSFKQLVQKAIQLTPNIPNEAGAFLENIDDLDYLSDLVVPYLSIRFEDRQSLLELTSAEAKIRKVHEFLLQEIEILELTQKLQTDVRSELNRQQRKYFLKEQLKLLQKELLDVEGRPPVGGASSNGGSSSSTSGGDSPPELKERIEKSAMPKEAKDAALKECERMANMHPGSPEATVSLTYVNTLLDLPWGVYTQKAAPLAQAREILDMDHHGLEKVKKRILQFLAVYSLKGDLKGPILLLAGPPGVGKTSLGKSVAKALGRQFVRIPLGGVRDEAEIRGHRRTYIGSLPGKIADALRKAGSMDPVILLDEVDKLTSDMRGDPSSALLEVLDPEQNNSFTDHYLNTPLDLSRVLFIATANTLQTIQPALKDRMEVLPLSGYTLDEKLHIAKGHLMGQAFEENGLTPWAQISIQDAVLSEIIQKYTREAGVRQLKRELASIARGIATEIAETPASERGKKKRKRIVTKDDVLNYLGKERFLESKKPKHLPIGVSTGLAWTSVGGDVLLVETLSTGVGSGKINLTGQLGDVMKESVHVALAFLRAHGDALGLSRETLDKTDLHIHFPEGATPKDGPSAGVAILLALLSQFRSEPLPSDLAMTGEISLRGDVLPVGGIKEKLMAAHRYGVKKVYIPWDNQKDLEDLPAEVKRDLDIRPLSRMSEALRDSFGLSLPENRKPPRRKAT